MNNAMLNEQQIKWLEKRDLTESHWNAITSSIFVGCNPNSVMLAIDYCRARGLDIMKKPCYIVPMSVKNNKTGSYEWRDVIMPSIAEQRITASRTGEYAGQDAPILGDMVEMKFGGETHVVPEFCTVTVYRLVNNERVAFTHTEYFDEACATKKDGDLNAMWSRRKRGQLAKCAEAGALRKAFPEEVGNTHTVEEMQGKTITVGGEFDNEAETEPAKLQMDISNDNETFQKVLANIANGELDKEKVLSGDAGYVMSDEQTKRVGA